MYTGLNGQKPICQLLVLLEKIFNDFFSPCAKCYLKNKNAFKPFYAKKESKKKQPMRIMKFNTKIAGKRPKIMISYF